MDLTLRIKQEETMDLTLRMTQGVSADIDQSICGDIFSTVYELHKQKRPTGGTEWFLVLKPAETNTVIEDGDNNQLATLDVKVHRKMYSIRDETEDSEIITLLYPEEY